MAVDPPALPSRNLFKWTAGTVVFALVAVLVGVTVNRWVAGYSIPDVEPFDVQQFASVSVPSERNAVTFFRQATAGFVDQRTFMALAPPASQAAFPASCEAGAKDWKLASTDVRRWLDANRQAMEIWKRGSQLDNALDVAPANVSIVTDSSLATNSTRMFARLALLEAARLASEGHVVEAWDWYRATLRTSRLIGMHAGLIPRLVGVATHAIATEAVIPWSARPELTAADLRRALTTRWQLTL